MHVVVTGASGTIGGALIDKLRSRGISVIGVSREPPRRAGNGVTWIGWDALSDAVASAAAVVHLAGAGIADRRWSPSRKLELRESRVETTRLVVETINAAAEKPSMLISASAVGYYGSRGDEELSESSAPGNDWLARLCQDWEGATEGAGVRTAILRFGIVLSAKGGALRRMRPPFRLGLGGPIGRGRQYWSWVHVDDAVGIAMQALESNEIEGPLNVTAPNAVTNVVFSRTLGRVLRRPAFFPIPPALLRLQLGDGVSVLTASQRVLPQRSRELGYEFQHPALEPALRDLIR